MTKSTVVRARAVYQIALQYMVQEFRAASNGKSFEKNEGGGRNIAADFATKIRPVVY